MYKSHLFSPSPFRGRLALTSTTFIFSGSFLTWIRHRLVVKIGNRERHLLISDPVAWNGNPVVWDRSAAISLSEHPWEWELHVGLPESSPPEWSFFPFVFLCNLKLSTKLFYIWDTLVWRHHTCPAVVTSGRVLRRIPPRDAILGDWVWKHLWDFGRSVIPHIAHLDMVMPLDAICSLHTSSFHWAGRL